MVLPVPDLTIFLLAGGKSSRMGQDKARMPFLGRPLVARAAARLASLGASVVVVANRPADFAFLGLPVLPDRVLGVGPLGGLAAALSAAQTHFAFTAACDMPFLNPRLVAAQYTLIQNEGADAVIPRSAGRLEPLHAVYRRETCLPAVLSSLEAERFSLSGWLSAVNTREMLPGEIEPFDPFLRSFTNLNTPEDFAQAEAWAMAEES